MPIKERAAFLAAVVLVLGGAYAAMYGLARLAVHLVPALSQAGAVPGYWFYLALPLIIVSLVAGALVGSAAWLLFMRLWFPRAYLRQYFTTPEIPVLTAVMERLFELLYPGK